uniref:Ubiquitin-like domain-containing protein n=1 Tax=Leersia perrieri TaxID=77586 RepID=A0A0D9XYF4_9ORYZ
MDVTFETASGRRFTVEIWYFSTVRRIKEYVLRQVGFPVESQRLFFAGAELDDDDLDTEHYSILHGSTLRLLLPDDKTTPPTAAVEDVRSPPVTSSPGAAAVSRRPRSPPRVTVKVKWGAKAAELAVSEMMVVKDLRAELAGGDATAAQLPLPNDGGYFFIYKQNVMEEDRTLRWHDVKDGDTIEIFNGRVTGGGG